MYVCVCVCVCVCMYVCRLQSKFILTTLDDLVDIETANAFFRQTPNIMKKPY